MEEKYGFKNRVGESSITNEGYDIKIIECFGRGDCTIQFEDGLILKNKTYQRFKDGSIKNPYHPSVYSIGYLGEGNYKAKINGKITTPYNTWRGILMRCYNEKTREKYTTYKDCSILEGWLNFQNFSEWFAENYREGYDLDKDILFKGNKIYSPETCCFIPQEINKLFTTRKNCRGEYPIGVCKRDDRFEAFLSIESKQRSLGIFNTVGEAFQAYKEAKEAYIKEIADKWKSKISKKAYQAMYNYKVEITD